MIIMNGSSGDRLVVSAGVAAAQDYSGEIVLPVGIEASAADALVSGALEANAGYHVFVAADPVTGAKRQVWSRAPVNPVMPAGYTKRRIIGGFLTDDNANIRRGKWYSDGSFMLNAGLPWLMDLKVSGPLGLQTLAVPQGLKMLAKMTVTAWDAADAGNPGFYVLIKDPDTGPVAGVDFDMSATFAKPAGFNINFPVSVHTDAAGQVYVGARATPVPPNAMVHILALGFTHPRSENA